MKKLRIVVLLATVCIIVFLLFVFFQKRPSGSGNVIKVSGNIEVTVAEVSFRIGGRVENRLFDEGEIVKKGDMIAILDSSDLERQVQMRQAELDTSKAALAELKAGTRPEEIAAARGTAQHAEAALTQLLNGSRPEEIEASRARVAAAQAEATRARANYKRAQELYHTETISAQEFDQAKQASQSADAQLKEAQKQFDLVKIGPRREEIDQARATAAQTRAQLQQAINGPRSQDIDQAQARVEQAQAALALAQTQLGYTKIYSPLSGVVLSKNIEPGEYVAPGTPVVTVGDLVNSWLRAYVSETDLGRVKVGQKVRVTTDTYPGKIYEGKVSFISSQAEFTPKNVQTEKERIKLVYRIKIDIQNPNMELKPGMPADAEIETSGAGR